jgi:hypothetical protein
VVKHALAHASGYLTATENTSVLPASSIISIVFDAIFLPPIFLPEIWRSKGLWQKNVGQKNERQDLSTGFQPGLSNRDPLGRKILAFFGCFS